MSAVIGVIADTHKLLRPEALAILHGVDTIVHAGDVGAPSVLTELAAIAPIHAIAGNIDRDPWANSLPETLDLTIEGIRIHVVHDLRTARPERIAHSDVVIAGHSHKPLVERRDETLVFNPGSAGPLRFKLPIAVGRLYLDAGAPRAEVIEIPVPAKR